MYVYEIGSPCQVMISVNSERTIGGKQYSAGMPYTILKDVNVSLLYENVTSEQNAKVPIFAARNARPYQLNISNLPLKKKVFDLMLTEDRGDTYIKTWEVVNPATEFYVSKQIEQSKPVFVLDADGNLLEVQSISGSRVILKEGIPEFISYFYRSETASSYSFEVPQFGYFSLDIHTVGNIDKNTSKCFMNFPAVSLISNPSFDFSKGANIANTNLTFDIIYNRQPQPTIIL